MFNLTKNVGPKYPMFSATLEWRMVLMSGFKEISRCESSERRHIVPMGKS
jgi:hypothetical protein